MARTFVTITYLALELRNSLSCAGGSGMTRIYLDELPAWLAARPGTMICSVVVL